MSRVRKSVPSFPAYSSLRQASFQACALVIVARMAANCVNSVWIGRKTFKRRPIGGRMDIRPVMERYSQPEEAANEGDRDGN